ncbi:MAG: response regulator [Pseudomonadota bacterium]
MANILLMEDDAVFALKLREILESEGHDIHWCRSGSEAIAALDQLDFDLVLTDIYVRRDGQVVDDGGISLIGKIVVRRLSVQGKKPPHLPIIAMSGAIARSSNPYVLQTAEGVGADYVLAKPFDGPDLMAVVEQALGLGKGQGQ